MFNHHYRLHGFVVVLFLLASHVEAQIYKWVDAKGQTHYSEKKDDAGQAKAAEIKVRLAASAPSDEGAKVPDWREQERQFQLRQAQKQPERTYRNVPASPGRGPSITQDESAKSKCALARAIIDGSAKHRNGARTDNNDMSTAKSDAQLFCN